MGTDKRAEKIRQEWTRAYLVKPRDNLTDYANMKAQKFTASYEKNQCQPVMSWILGGEYARIWRRERDLFIEERKKKEKPKFIGNDFLWWLQKRIPKEKKEKKRC